MKKKIARFPISNHDEFKIKMLNWSDQFNIFCFLDNNRYAFEEPSFECLLAAGSSTCISTHEAGRFDSIKNFSLDNPGWLFGHINYPDLSPAATRDDISFPGSFFFRPEILLTLKENVVTIETEYINPDEIFSAVIEQPEVIKRKIATKADLESRYTKEDYLGIVGLLQKHIQRGDCYEINFCQDFYARNAVTDPIYFYYALAEFSPAPFAALYKVDDKFCICASPERFLKRTGNSLISQPIKGTAKRNLFNSDADLKNKEDLANNAKEKSENVMIVDLVRNDMSKICLEGSVHVRELCGIYVFPQVHHMISTIKGSLANDKHWTEIMEACFPMGSMTGAPKTKVMELINKYEISPRGLFSGTIGYVKPNGDFDFNVVIRSLFYHATKKIISFSAGGAVTFYSSAEEEYQESLLKASAIMKVLTQS